MTYPKRLIEVDLPIALILTHERWEKSIGRGRVLALRICYGRKTSVVRLQ